MHRLTALLALLIVTLPAHAVQIQEVDPDIPVAVKGEYFLSPDGQNVWMEERHSDPQLAYPQVFQLDTRTGKLLKTLHHLKPQPSWWGILSGAGSEGQTLAVSPTGMHVFGFFPFDLARLPQKGDPLKEDADARRRFEKGLSPDESPLPSQALATRLNLMDGRIHLISPMEPFQDSDRHIAASLVALRHVTLGQGDRYLAASYRAHFPDTLKVKTGIRIWNTQTGKVHADLPEGVPAFHGQRLYVLTETAGLPHVLTYYPPQFALETDRQSPLRARHLTISPDGRTLVLLGENEDQLALIRQPGFQEIQRIPIKLPANDGDRFQHFRWSPDSRLLAMASRQGRLFILDTVRHSWVGRYDLQIARSNPQWGQIAMQWSSPQDLVVVGGRDDLERTRPVIIRLTGF